MFSYGVLLLIWSFSFEFLSEMAVLSYHKVCANHFQCLPCPYLILDARYKGS